MGKLLLLVSLIPICLLGGCTIVRIVPPLHGSVVDAATGAPIKSATVNVKYFNSTRTDRTDSQGRFSFGAKHMLVTFVPVHLDRVSGFTLNVEADRYHPTDLHSRGHPASSSPEAPPRELDPSRSDGHKITYMGKALVIAPIQLTPVTDTAP
jgi:hypothetical protein